MTIKILNNNLNQKNLFQLLQMQDHVTEGSKYQIPVDDDYEGDEFNAATENQIDNKSSQLYSKPTEIETKEDIQPQISNNEIKSDLEDMLNAKIEYNAIAEQNVVSDSIIGIGSGLTTSIDKTEKTFSIAKQSGAKEQFVGNVNIQAYLANNPQNSSTSGQPESHKQVGYKYQDQSIQQFENVGSITVPNMDLTEDESPHELSKTAVFQLLRKFKIQQYAHRMSQFGFAQDIYKLAFMSHREREELMDNLNMLPGHRDKMFDLFRIIEQLNPKHTLRSTLQNAAKQQKRSTNMTPGMPKVSDYRQSRSKNRSVQKAEPQNSQWSNDNVGVSQTSLHNLKTCNIGNVKPPLTLSSYNQNHSSKISNSTYSSNNKIYGQNGLVILNDNSNMSNVGTNQISESNKRQQILKEQQMQNRISTHLAVRSLSKGKQKRDTSDSITRLYNQLDSHSKLALNSAFLTNVKSGRNHQTFHQALQDYQNRSIERKKARNAIDTIFPVNKMLKEQKKKVIKDIDVAAKAYLRQTKSSATKKAIASMANEKRKMKSNSRERQSTNSNVRKSSLQRQQSDVNNNNYGGVPVPRPPLIPPGGASAQKSGRKKAALPPFIQTQSQGVFNIGSNKKTFSGAKESSSTRASARQGQKFLNHGTLTDFKRINASKERAMTSNMQQHPQNPLSIAPRSTNHYEKYETPEKNSYIYLKQQNANQNSAKKQRLRSSSQSTNKLQNDGSKNSLFQNAKGKEQNERSIKKDSKVNKDLDYSRDDARSKNASKMSGKGDEFFQNRRQSAKQTRGASAKGPRPPRNDNHGSYTKPRDVNFRELQSNRQMKQNMQNIARKSSGSRKALNSSTNQSSSKKINIPLSSNQKTMNSGVSNSNATLPKIVSGRVDTSNEARDGASKNLINELNQSQQQDSDLNNFTSLMENQSINKTENAIEIQKPQEKVKDFQILSTNNNTSAVEEQENSIFEAVGKKESDRNESYNTNTKNTNQSEDHSDLRKEEDPLEMGTVANNSSSQPSGQEEHPSINQQIADSKNNTPCYSTPEMISPMKQKEVKKEVETKPSDIRISGDTGDTGEAEAEAKAEEEAETEVEQPKTEQIEMIEEHVDAINDLSSPLLDKYTKMDAFQHGYSFNSKKMAMAPAFFNLRIICDCLGRAIRRHIDFSQPTLNGEEVTCWFLDELNEAKKQSKLERKRFKQEMQKITGKKPKEDELEESGATAGTDFSNFTYNFKDDLKIGDIQNQQDSDDEDFERNLDNQDVDISSPAKKQIKAPEKQNQAKEEFMKIQMGLEGTLEVDATDLQAEAQDDLKEQQHIEEVRRSELAKQIEKTSMTPTASDAKKKKPEITNKSYVQMQLIEKDKKIRELAKMVQMYETGKKSPSTAKNIQEVMVISNSPTGLNKDLDDEELLKKYDADVYKMSRAEFLMAQIDLDPIESNYSKEQEQLSSNLKYKPQNALRLQKTGSRIQNSDARNQIEENLETAGNEANQTMVDDNSFKDVSQGRSLNQSNGDNVAKMVNSGNLDDSGSGGFKMMPVPEEQKVEKKVLKKKEKVNPIKNFGTEVEREEQIEVLSEHIRFFDERLDFDNDEQFNPDIEILDPSVEDIAAYSKYVTIASKMENEAPVVALVYIERLLLKTGILVNKYNWKRILLVCLCVASKVWDDDSLENVHFPKVMSDVTINMINKLEQIFLDMFLNYDLVVKGSEYAKYYFIMRSLADELRDQALSDEEKALKARKKKRRDDWAEFPLQKPISAEQMLQLQRNSAKAEIFLKENYEKEVILALADKFKGNEQRIREKKFFNEQHRPGKKSDLVEGMLSSTM